jgi:hypothetical protein
VRHRGIEWRSVRARARERERERERVSRIKSRSVHFGGRGVAISNQMDRSNNHGVRVTTCGVFVTTRCACSRRDEGKTSLRGGCKAVGTTACNTACRESGGQQERPKSIIRTTPTHLHTLIAQICVSSSSSSSTSGLCTPASILPPRPPSPPLSLPIHEQVCIDCHQSHCLLRFLPRLRRSAVTLKVLTHCLLVFSYDRMCSLTIECVLLL